MVETNKKNLEKLKKNKNTTFKWKKTASRDLLESIET
jgi:hypothetical protein